MAQVCVVLSKVRASILDVLHLKEMDKNEVSGVCDRISFKENGASCHTGGAKSQNCKVLSPNFEKFRAHLSF